MLGVEQPKIKVVGRVPLGKAKQGRNRFRWDGKVAGKRLKPGKYLLTYRLLRDDEGHDASRVGPVHRQAMTWDGCSASRIASARSACRRLAPSATPCIQ